MDRPVIVGYAVVWDAISCDLGGFVETVRRGAFDKYLGDKGPVVAKVSHESGPFIVGRTTDGTLKLSVDDTGLRFECLPEDTAAGRAIVSLVRSREIKHASFCFHCYEGGGGERWLFNHNPPLREITEALLTDVAPCKSPAYRATSCWVEGDWSTDSPRITIQGIGDYLTVQKHFMA